MRSWGYYHVFIIREWLTMLIDIIFVDSIFSFLSFFPSFSHSISIALGKSLMQKRVQRSMCEQKKTKKYRGKETRRSGPFFSSSQSINFEWSNLNNFTYELNRCEHGAMFHNNAPYNVFYTLGCENRVESSQTWMLYALRKSYAFSTAQLHIEA